MPKSVEFFFDYGSPASYIAFKRLPAIVEKTGAQVIDRPMLLGGVIKATGNSTPMEVPAKATWFFADMDRTARRHGVPYQKNPAFPINTLYLMRGAIFARKLGRLADYSAAMFKAVWEDGENCGDPQVVARVLTAAGFDAKAVFAACEDPDIKAELKAETDAAVARGVFGAPTFIIDGELQFGQDRLDCVEEALAR